jgi:hypothetical protein
VPSGADTVSGSSEPALLNVSGDDAAQANTV